LIINNGGAVSTREIREVYKIEAGNGLGSVGNRLSALMRKKIISKVRGLNGEVIYFLIDLSYFEYFENLKNRKNRKKLSEEDLRDIERMIREGYSLGEIAKKKGISWRWCAELYRRYREHGKIFLKRPGRPLVSMK